MSLQELLNEGKLEPTATSKREIQDLMEVASRSLSDAMVEQLSQDGRFNCAYDASLMFATIPLRCAGYRTRGEGHHFTIFDVLPEIIGTGSRPMARYLQKCRKIRNLSTYSRSGIVTIAEVKELIAKTQELGEAVRKWLQEKYPEYC